MRVPSDRVSESYRARDTMSVFPRISEVDVRQPISTGVKPGFVEALGKSRAQRKKINSLLEYLEYLSLPSINDVSLLGFSRSTEVLQYVINSILPRLEVDSEVVRLAEQLLIEEIEFRMECKSRQVAVDEERGP